MNNTDHARARRLKRRANKLGENGYRIVPHRQRTSTGNNEGWQLIENVTNVRVAPSTGNDPVSLDEIEAAIERLEELAAAY